MKNSYKVESDNIGIYYGKVFEMISLLAYFN